MRNLYFIRHAESEANKKRILASRQPFPLTTAGVADARLIASELKEKVSIDTIISSPLIRAQQTAEAFCEVYNLPLTVDERLSEQDLGPYSGMNYDEVKNEAGYQMETLARWGWVPGGIGESYAMVADRITSFLESMNDWPQDSNTLIVTHAVVFRLLRAALENTLPVYPKDFPNNGEIWKVEFQGLGVKNQIESILLGDSENFIHNP